MIELLFMFMVFGGMVVAGGALTWLLFSRRGLRGLKEGSYWQERLERLETEVKRLGDLEARHELDDEVRRLDEKVEFLEALLADRSKTGALPAGDKGDSGGNKPHPE